MITGPNGTITLDPDRLVAAGDHRYRIDERLLVTERHVAVAQTWTCERCGQTTWPTAPYTPCPAGPA